MECRFHEVLVMNAYSQKTQQLNETVITLDRVEVFMKDVEKVRSFCYPTTRNGRLKCTVEDCI